MELYLPDEVWLLILRHADGDAICSASCVNKRLSQFGAESLSRLQAGLRHDLKDVLAVFNGAVAAVRYFSNVDALQGDPLRAKLALEKLARGYERYRRVSNSLYQRLVEKKWRICVEMLKDFALKVAKLLFEALVTAREMESAIRHTQCWAHMEVELSSVILMCKDPDRVSNALSDFEHSRSTIHRHFNLGEEWRNFSDEVQQSMAPGITVRTHFKTLLTLVTARRRGQQAIVADLSYQALTRVNRLAHKFPALQRESIRKGPLLHVQQHLEKIKDLGKGGVLGHQKPTPGAGRP